MKSVARNICNVQRRWQINSVWVRGTATGVMKQENRSSGLKNSHRATLPTKIPHDLAWGRDRASEKRSRWLTVWHTTGPFWHAFQVKVPCSHFLGLYVCTAYLAYELGRLFSWHYPVSQCEFWAAHKIRLRLVRFTHFKIHHSLLILQLDGM